LKEIALSDYQYYMVKAAEMHEMARRATTPESKNEFVRLAAEYERLAAAAWPNKETGVPESTVKPS
jgi:hypothetical protein